MSHCLYLGVSSRPSGCILGAFDLIISDEERTLQSVHVLPAQFKPMISDFHEEFKKFHEQIQDLQGQNKLQTVRTTSRKYREKLDGFINGAVDAEYQKIPKFKDVFFKKCLELEEEFSSVVQLLTQASLLWNLCEIRYFSPFSAVSNASFSVLSGSMVENTEEVFSLLDLYSDITSWFSNIILLPQLQDLPAFPERPNETTNEIWATLLRWTMIGRLEDVVSYLHENLSSISNSFGADNSSWKDAVSELVSILSECPILMALIKKSELYDCIIAELVQNMILWQNKLNNLFSKSVLSSHEELRCLVDILAGSIQAEAQWKAQTRSAGHWSHLFISQMLYASPVTSKVKCVENSGVIVDSFNGLNSLVQKCVSWWKSVESEDFSPFEKCVVSVLSGNLIDIVALMDSVIAIPLVTTHLVDLLCEDSIPNVINNGITLREYYILQYAQSLAYDSSCWKYSFPYFECCSTAGAFSISSMLQYQAGNVSCRADAYALLNLCDFYNFGRERSSIMKVFAQKSLLPFKSIIERSKFKSNDVAITKVSQLGDSFFWLSLSRQFNTISALSIQLLHLFCIKTITLDVLQQTLTPMTRFHSISYEFDFLKIFFEFQVLNRDSRLGNDVNLIPSIEKIVEFTRNDAVPLQFGLFLLRDISILLQQSKVKLSMAMILALLRFMEISLAHFDVELARMYTSAADSDSIRNTLMSHLDISD